MKGTVKKWGNSAAIRIPYQVLEAASLSIEEEVKSVKNKAESSSNPSSRRSMTSAR